MHSVTIQPGGTTIQVDNGETVLDAALRQGLILPYGCKDGVCGSCKGRLVTGELDYGHYHLRVLSEAERAHGKALLCQAKPLSDAVIEVRSVAKLRGIRVKTLPVRVRTIDRRSPDVAVLTLQLPYNDRLEFLAGQYLDILLQGGERRSFSMANAPQRQDALELHVRHVPGGRFTDHVFQAMQPREILRCEGPHGNFFLREDSAKPSVLLASGTGFAPMKSLLEDAFLRGIDRRVTLYWGGRRPRDLYLSELPERWAAEHPNFRYVPVVSDPLPEDVWQGRTGLVHRAVLTDLPDLSRYQVYACGVPVMVEAAQRDFLAHGLPEDEFFADSFATRADLASEPAV